MSFASGKIIIIGEHAVVHGEPAIAAAIDKGVSVHVQTHTEDTLAIEPWGLSFGTDEQQPTGLAFKKLLSLFETKNRAPLLVKAQVELAGGAGLGCSAALGVAILSGLNDFLSAGHSKSWVNDNSLLWEKVFHGNPSGIDNFAATFGGIVMFKKGGETSVLHSPNELYFVVGFSGQPSSTKRMISNIENLLHEKPSQTQEMLSNMGQLSKKSAEVIARGNVLALGTYMNQNHSMLKKLGISTENLDQMCQVARDAGALGAKLTGGGGGGCMIALAKTKDQAKAIAQALKPMDPQVFQTQTQ